MEGRTMDETRIPVSASLAETLYRDFDTFVAQFEGRHGSRRVDNLIVWGLIRLARNDIERAKRVFEWAVVQPYLQHIAGYKYPIAAISSLGMEQLRTARSRFGQNPQLALVLVECICVLESIAGNIERDLKHLQPDMDFAEFRRRPPTDDDLPDRQEWLGELYDKAGTSAAYAVSEYTQVRDCAIMLGITGLADGAPPTTDEVHRMLRGLPPSRLSAKQQRSKAAFLRLDIERSLVGTDPLIEWILGKHWDEMLF